MKFHDQRIGIYYVPDDPEFIASRTQDTFRPLLDISQGTGADDRIGREIRVETVQVMAIIRPVNLVIPCQVSIFLVLDRQANGACPDPGEIFHGADVFCRGMRNLAFIDRFSILHREDHFINPLIILNNQVLVRFAKRIKLDAVYKADYGYWSDLASNSLWLLFASDVGDSSSLGKLEVHGMTRVRFSDKQ